MKYAATVTVLDAPRMTARGRRSVVAWLRRQALYVERHSAQLSKRYTARYIYQ